MANPGADGWLPFFDDPRGKSMILPDAPPDAPIAAVLPELLVALRDAGAAVLVAPPGAGKTTGVPPALLAEPWCTGTIVVLSPRRVAARAAAERIADMLGERVGETIGYLTRLDSRRSASTRVLVMTEAIFVASILDDPDLAGVSAVLFDEAHERRLDADLGLALAIESREVLRPDLRLLTMSATIDGARFASLLGSDHQPVPVIASEGRAHPLAIRWLGARPDLRLDEAMALAIGVAWREQEGDILAFLPGVGEIERLRDRLANSLPQALVLPLHGQCDPAAQRSAIRRDPQARRRIVLATAIAETSLTLDGVSVVVDAGLSRRAEFDRATGVTRLVTHRASQAASAQRAGRAARQGPGVAYRLWEEAAHAGRAAYDPPEMLSADLAPLVLVLARCGATDPAALRWLDPPPAPSLGAARARLAALGAVDPQGRITPQGAAMASLPLEPPLAYMLLFAARYGVEEEAARLALLLQERGLGGRGEDLADRADRLARDRSARADGSRKLAARWARLARGLQAPLGGGEPADTPPPPAVLLAEAFPDNVARRRAASHEDWLTAGGRGLRLDQASPLVGAEFLAVGEAQGDAKGARITAALALTAADVDRWLSTRIERTATLRWRADEARVEALVERRLGALVLARGPDPEPDAAAIAAFLSDRVRDGGLALLPLSQESLALLRRARFAGIAALSEAMLLAELDQWLAPSLRRRLADIDAVALHEALRARLAHADRTLIERLAPPSFVTPAGTRHAIDYADEGGPSVEVRVQALFGLDRHPTFGDPPAPLLLRLTSPAGRPIQVTRDLPGFWRGSWTDVRRDMKGRYPRHRWPDEPWTEEASLRTRNALASQRGS